MVFVAVGDENGSDTVPVFPKVSEVRDGEIDPGHVLFREQNASVDDDDVVVELQHHHVSANLAQPT